jgi:ketosteroid isomerase-like protein
MGAEENVEVMQRAYDAFNKADLDTLTETFDENAVWHAPGRTPLAGDYEGRDATFAYLGGLGEKTDGTFRANLRQLVPGEDGLVVGVQRSTAERAGKSLDVANCIVFQLEGGRITEVWEHFDDLYAWDEFWS